MQYKRMPSALVLIATLALSACGSVAGPGTAPPGPPSYRTGYRDGCGSGMAYARPEIYRDKAYRDDKKYASDGDYQRGWDEGSDACYQDVRQHQPLVDQY